MSLKIIPVTRLVIERREKVQLASQAAFNRTRGVNEKRLYPEPPDQYRTRFARDRDRIIHSVHYILLDGKSQVFPVLPGIKPITTKRLFHVQRVAQLARDIGRALGLNEDLIEAIGLAHDIGHCAFGHAGEKGIQLASAADLALIGTRFSHERWALRVVDGLEFIEGRSIPGLNLTFEVRDGISRHCGEKLENSLVPSREFDLNIEALPTTLEGCLVKIVDVVGYAPQDLRDFMNAGFIIWAEVPAPITRVLGTSIRQMYDTMVKDIIKNSQGKNMICMSDRCFQALQELAAFNMTIIREKFGENEERIVRMVGHVYQDRKAKGETPLQIIDHLISLTDAQLYKEAVSLKIENGAAV